MPMNTGTAVRELKIGPYAGGINQYSDISAIADDEMVDCTNFDIDLDGSLKSRPPWRLLDGTFNTTAAGSVPPVSYQTILLTGTYNAIRFIIIQTNHTGVDGVYVYYLDGGSAGTLNLIAAGDYSTAVRYNDDVFITPALSAGLSLGTGQRHNLVTAVNTPIANMPRGYSSTVYKERMWITGRRTSPTPSRLFFSALADFTSWPGSNFFDINPGDGDAAQDLAVYQDNLMVFKDGATYVLSYDSNVAQAVLQVVNTDVGVVGPRCVAAYENSIFLLQYNKVFEMVNYDFTRVSVKIPFEYDDTTPGTVEGQAWQFKTWLRLCGDRIVVRFFNRLYVYHLRLRAWTRWVSEDINIQGLGPIVELDKTNTQTDMKLGHDRYVATSSLLKNTDNAGNGTLGNWRRYFKMFIMDDLYEATFTENGNLTPPVTPVDIKCSLTTKTYDIGLSHRFKRLMHWGVDTITGRTITGTIFPFSIAYSVTWTQLHAYQWSELNTWSYPLFVIPSTSQTQPVGAGLSRRYIRFPKSLRFRLVQFKVDMLTLGNTSDGPARIYSVTAFIGGKQLTPLAVN
jgi:hypothetical protein